MNLTQFKASDHSTSPHLLLVGNPVSHSLSPLMHNTAARFHNLPHRYHAIRLENAELNSFAAYLNNEQLRGVNVTIPHKQQMLNIVDQLDSTCNRIGALNTIVKDGSRLVGFNTDIYGFCEPLIPHQQVIEEQAAVVFGTGGAARAIVYGLAELGVMQVVLVSRNPQKAKTEMWPDFVEIVSYDAWPSFADETALFVNATPLGMEPDFESCPVEKELFECMDAAICYDIVYKPRRTTFLKRAEAVNARTIEGLEMLIHQGSRSFKLWTGKTFPIDIIREKLNKYLSDENRGNSS